MNEIKEKTIKALIKQECFIFNGGPFVSSSGFKVPFFIDVRRLFSDPEILRFISMELLNKCKESDIASLAGAETAGIPFASAMSVLGDLPFFYVRKNKQDHGMKSVIAGCPPDKQERIALIDDSVGGGGSAEVFLKNLKDEGYETKLLLYVLEMNIWHNATERMDSLCKKYDGLKYFYLATWDEWINYMYENEYISEVLRDVCIESTQNPLLFNEEGKLEWYYNGVKDGTVWCKCS